MLKSAMSLASAMLLSATAAAQSQPEPRSITVSGTATIRVVPDEVVITLNVQTLNKDLRKAKADNDARVQKVLAVVKDFQIDPRLVQTTEATLAPHWKTTRDQRELDGYQATNQIHVTLKELRRYDEFIGRAIDAGEALLDGIEFNSSETIAKRAEARKMALHAAQEKARAMAVELDQKIGKPLSIIEEPAIWSGWSQSNAFAQARATEEGTAPDVATVAVGQIEITARVSVRFELE